MAYIEKKLAAEYNILLSPTDFSNQKQLGLKLKLWNEQDGKCLYSGKTIEPEDLIKHSELFQIDHIIPRSISFDDSRNNKVLVYGEEIRRKEIRRHINYLIHANNPMVF